MAAVVGSTVADAPAIKALGPLFRLTEVFLWDDTATSVPDNSIHCGALEEEPKSSSTSSDISSNIKYAIDDFTSVEDLELAQHMNALGLPSSFSTTKEKNVTNGGKGKGIRAKPTSSNRNKEKQVHGLSKISQSEDIVSTVIPARDKIVEVEFETSHSGVEEEHGLASGHSDLVSRSVSVTLIGESGQKKVADGLPEPDMLASNYVEKDFTLSCNDSDVLDPLSLNAKYFPGNVVEDTCSGLHLEGALPSMKPNKCLEDSSVSCNVTGARSDDSDGSTFQPCPNSMESSLSCELIDNHVQYDPDYSHCCEFGDWRVVWDPLYMRNYFYNFRLEESTWYPPPGLEHFTFSCIESNSNEMFADVAEANSGFGFASNADHDEDLHLLQDTQNLPQDSGNDFESSLEVSSRMDTGLSANFGSEQSAGHIVDKRVADEQVQLQPLDAKDHTIDKMDITENLIEQEDTPIRFEAGTVPDIPSKHLISRRSFTTFNDTVYEENDSSLLETCTTSTIDELDSCHEIVTRKKKKRVRRLQSRPTRQGEIEGLSPNVVKYWCQRYSLFSKFDDGIKMDEEGWFSVTPEHIARHHASRCGTGIIIDCFTGVGGNAIQFAERNCHVIAIDIDAQRIDYAQQNAAIYGVRDRIDFIKGDFFQVAPRLKGDIVFMSPPWGGPDYAKVQTYDIGSMLKPCDGYHLFKIARMIAPKVIMFLPRNVDLNQLAELSLLANPPLALEVEKNFLNGKLKAITAYFTSTTI